MYRKDVLQEGAAGTVRATPPTCEPAVETCGRETVSAVPRPSQRRSSQDAAGVRADTCGFLLKGDAFRGLLRLECLGGAAEPSFKRAHSAQDGLLRVNLE